MRYLQWRTVSNENSKFLSKLFKTSSLEESMHFANTVMSIFKQHDIRSNVFWSVTGEDFTVGLHVSMAGPIAESWHEIARKIDEGLANNTFVKFTECERSSYDKSSGQDPKDWKFIKDEEGNESLSQQFPAGSLGKAAEMAHVAAKIVSEYNLSGDVLLAVDPTKLHIGLHLFAKGAVPDIYLKAAEKIGAAL